MNYRFYSAIILVSMWHVCCLGSITFTTLTSKDYKDYKELYQKAIEQTDPTVFAMSLEDLPDNPTVWKEKLEDATKVNGKQQNFWVLIARVDGKAVGFIEAEREWAKESYLKHLVTITKLFVDKEYQHQGIAKYLMRYLINQLAQDPTIKALDLRVPSNQTTTIDLYKKFGFEAVSPHKHAALVNGVFHPHYYMKTTMDNAWKISEGMKKKQASTLSDNIKIVNLDPEEDKYPYRNINIHALEQQSHPHIFAVAPKDDKGLFIDFWQERLELAQKPAKGKQQNLWILAAEHDGKLIGLIEAEREYSNHTYKKHVVCITRVFVDNAYQGKGLGKRLMQSMIDLLHKDKSITALELWVAAYTEGTTPNPAVPFYKSFGFEQADPHDYAVRIGEKYYPHTLMSTTIEDAKKAADAMAKKHVG